MSANLISQLVVYLPENKLYRVIKAEHRNVNGVILSKVIDADDKDAQERILPAIKFRPATEADLPYIEYLFTDENTGEIQTLKIQKVFIEAIPAFIKIGKDNAVPTKNVLSYISKKDTDTNRRQFRAAVGWWIDRGLVICSTTSGYFVAANSAEVNDCVVNKRRQADANLKRAAFLESMDVEASKVKFLEMGVTKCETQ